MQHRLTLGDIANEVGGEVRGDLATPVQGLGSLGTARTGQISHLSSPSYHHLLATTGASVVILKQEHADQAPCATLVVDNPYLTFARVSQLFRHNDGLPEGVHASALIAQDAEIHPSARIGANVVIGARTRIEAQVQIHPNSVIGDDCLVGANSVIRSNVTVYSDVKLGARCLIHSGVVLGADGFGFTPDEQGRWQGIAQLGGVTIGSDVSIGANSCIDRGAIDDTVIEDGVQIDNLVQIGHNCKVGAHSLLCGVVALAGSTTIGKHCVFAGRAGAGGDLPVEVCDGVMVSSSTVISQSVDKPGVYSGSVLFQDHNKWRRNALRFGALDELFKRVRKLERKSS